MYLAGARIRAGLTDAGPADAGLTAAQPAATGPADAGPAATGTLEVLAEVGSAGAPLGPGWRVRVEAEGLDEAVVAPARPATQTDIPSADGASPQHRSRLNALQYRRAAGLPLPADERADVEALEADRRGLGIGEALVRVELPGVRPWSAEQPRLYELTVSLLDESGDAVETARFRVGFRRVEVIGNDLLVNGRRVLIRGMNRHDVDAGYRPGGHRRARSGQTW